MWLIRLVNRFAAAIVSVSLVVLIAIAPQDGLIQSALAQDVTGLEAAQKAQQQYQKGDLNGALQTLDAAIDAEPRYDLYVMRAQARLAAKKFPGVIEDAEAILADRPGDLAGVNLKLVALTQQEKITEALDFIDSYIASNPDVAKFPSAKAELLATLILQGDETIRKYLPDASAFQLKSQLRPALNHTIAASVQLQQKQQARVFAANIYGRLKEYGWANSALTHAINADTNDDPRLRMMRVQVREQWGDLQGVAADLSVLANNQHIRRQNPDPITQINEQLGHVNEQIEAQKGPVYRAVLALRKQPSDMALRDAVVAAVEQIERDGEANPLFEELVVRRKVHTLYPEPNLDTIKNALKQPDDIKLALAADPVRSGSLHIIRAQNDAAIKPSAKERALIEQIYNLNQSMLAGTSKTAKDGPVRNRHTKILNLYPDHKHYRDLARLDYMTGNYASAKRRAMLAAASAAVKLYEDPSAATGMGGVTIKPARALYRSAERLANAEGEQVETSFAKACWHAERGDFLMAGDLLEQAYVMDRAGRNESAPVLDPVLRDLEYTFKQRYIKPILDAYVNEALRADKAEDADRYEQLIKRMMDRYPYVSHANSRVLLSQHAEKTGDEKKAESYLNSALSIQPLNGWGNMIKGDRLNAAGQAQQAMLHYNVAAGLGTSTDQLKGLAKEAGQKRDAIEQQLNLPVGKLYGAPIDAMRAESERANANLIYASSARLLRAAPQNKNLLKIMLTATYYMRDSEQASRTMKQLVDRPVEPAMEPGELAWAHRLYGWTVIDGDQNYRDAIAAFTASLEANPEAATYSARAQAYHKLRWHDQAIADANKVIEMNEATWSVYSVRAQAHERLGNLEQANKDIQEALRLQKEADGKNNLGLSNVAQRIMIKNLNNLGKN